MSKFTKIWNIKKLNFIREINKKKEEKTMRINTSTVLHLHAIFWLLANCLLVCILSLMFTPGASSALDSWAVLGSAWDKSGSVPIKHFKLGMTSCSGSDLIGLWFYFHQNLIIPELGQDLHVQLHVWPCLWRNHCIEILRCNLF